MKLLIVAALLLLSACGPKSAAFGNTLGACELGQLPSTLQGVIASVAGILFGGADQTWQGDLGALGVKLLPGQLDCVVAAVGASIKARMVHGQAAPEYVEAGRRADAWIGRGKRAP